MAIRKYKPTTPGRRGASGSDFSEVTRTEPEKSLVRPLHSRGGRNVHGRVTTRHQGGGHKRAYRLIDFKRADKDGVPAKVAHIEYDPNRTSRIALLHYADGEKRYIICPAGGGGGGALTERSEPEKSRRPLHSRGAGTSRPRHRRHQGGGHKRSYRLIDFSAGQGRRAAKVAHIEYDPNRTDETRSR